MAKHSRAFRFIAAIAFAVCLPAGIAADERVSAEAFFDVSFGDLQDELATVVDEDKKGLLIMFEMEACPWCDRMKQQVLNRSRVHEYFKAHFRIITVDVEGDVPVVDFTGNEQPSKVFSLKQMRVRATPVFVFFDPAGKIMARYTGAVKNVHDFLLLGEYVVDDHYLHSGFNKFRRENQG